MITTPDKLARGRALVAKVEADLGYAITSNIIDLFMDNARALNFSDMDCLDVGNAIRVEKGLMPVAKWWK